jgi:hypothetical protein
LRDLVVDFLTVDRGFTWRIETETDAIATNFHDCQDDVVTDYDSFAELAREHEHGLSFLMDRGNIQVSQHCETRWLTEPAAIAL